MLAYRRRMIHYVTVPLMIITTMITVEVRDERAY